ncbi:hypothetical protein JMJ55_23140 [Belnapia sp. T6]|uniref:LysR substrate-binding domain-containing protein n=1 Tax=Belnapia mucosa TaxID=2804532 RepID=A0ABS1V989_9PROT|nr:hypothetical protein [Belnapia mucosa]
MQRLADRAPQLRIAVVEADTDALIGMLSDGRVDMAVARMSTRFSATLLRQITLHAEQGMVVASPGHVLAQNAALTLGDCLQAAWALPAEGSPTRMAIDTMFAAAGLPNPEPLLEIMSVGSLLAALDGGNLLTVLPEVLSRRLAAHGNVALLPLIERCDLPPVSLYLLKDGFQDPAATLLAAELQDLVRILGGAGPSGLAHVTSTSPASERLPDEAG